MRQQCRAVRMAKTATLTIAAGRDGLYRYSWKSNPSAGTSPSVPMADGSWLIFLASVLSNGQTCRISSGSSVVGTTGRRRKFTRLSASQKRVEEHIPD